MGYEITLTLDPDGYWGGVDRDWEVYRTRAPRRPHEVGLVRRVRETTGWVVKWGDRWAPSLLLADEVLVATSDDGERRVEWRGGRRV